MKTLIILFLSMTLFTATRSNGQVEIIPGKGIVFSNDSIIISKSSPKDLCKIFNIIDTFEIDHASVEDYGADGKLINNGLFANKSIIYHEFEFQFNGYKDNEILLRNIYINLSTQKHKLFLSSHEIDSTSIKVARKFRKSTRKEMNPHSTISYSDSSYSGITFLVDKSGKIILKICVNTIDKT